MATLSEPNSAIRRRSHAYRFGFVLTTAAGNMTRYLNLRKYAERDTEAECVWAPVSHYMEPDPYSSLPGPLRTRLIVRRQARPVMAQLGRLDAVMYHVFEPFLWAVARTVVRRKPLVVWSQDNPPMADQEGGPRYGGAAVRSPWRAKLRYRFDCWCIRRAALCFPFSTWAATAMIRDCRLPSDAVHPIHVGLDLELWPYTPKTAGDGQLPRILFVGGDFVRKGGDLLLDVYQRCFAGQAELHLVTQMPPRDLPAGVTVYTGLGPNDPALRRLYAEADLFALPTRADMMSWVSMEAMATGCPVISTPTGGIPDLVIDGKTGFLVAPNDGDALADRIRTLLENPALRRGMGAEGRALVEREFNAAVCVPRILARMKEAVDNA